MSPAELQNLRVAVAQQLRSAGGYALPVEALSRGARLVGFPTITEAEIRAELVYLADKQLVAVDQKIVSPELKRWRLTAAGRDWLAEEGL